MFKIDKNTNVFVTGGGMHYAMDTMNPVEKKFNLLKALFFLQTMELIVSWHTLLLRGLYQLILTWLNLLRKQWYSANQPVA